MLIVLLLLKVAQAYLEHLLKEGKFQEAASQCPRLLKVSPASEG